MSDISGVYKISCLPNGRTYVGSSANVGFRWKRHLTQLRNGNHHNIHLQRAWDKYGEESFVFEVVFEGSKEEILKEEQRYLNDYCNLFNIAKVAVRSDKPQPKEEVGRKISLALTGRKMTDIQKKRMSLSRKGNKCPWAKEQALTMNKNKEQEYIAVSPSNKVYHFRNARAFSKQHCLEAIHLSAVARGRYKHHQGWIALKVDDYVRSVLGIRVLGPSEISTLPGSDAKYIKDFVRGELNLIRVSLGKKSLITNNH